jgi:hypothetical protein
MTLSQWKLVWQYYTVQWQLSVADDRERGEVSTTTVILTFILAGLALAVGAIIADKVRAKAESIPVDG